MVKRILIVICLLALTLVKPAAAIESKMFNLRGALFDQSKVIQKAIPTSKDIFILNTLFNTCILTISQVDAYFSMMDIFNSVRKDDLTASNVQTLTRWLSELKYANDMNLKSLGSFSVPVDPATTEYIGKLKSIYTELNKMVDAELNKVSILKKSIKPSKKK